MGNRMRDEAREIETPPKSSRIGRAKNQSWTILGNVFTDKSCRSTQWRRCKMPCRKRPATVLRPTRRVGARDRLERTRENEMFAMKCPPGLELRLLKCKKLILRIFRSNAICTWEEERGVKTSARCFHCCPEADDISHFCESAIYNGNGETPAKRE